VNPGTYEACVLVRGLKMVRRTVVYRTVRGDVVSHSDYFVGKNWLSDRINQNEPLFREIDAAIKKEFDQ
jgi:hypothetical protein